MKHKDTNSNDAAVERCFACDRKLGKARKQADTRDDQIVVVGSECFKLIAAAGDAGYQPPKGGPRLYPAAVPTKLSANQQKVLRVLESYRPVVGGERGWKTTPIFDPRTVRSLIARGLVQPSTRLPWMLKHNLDDMTIRITPEGIAALSETRGLNK